MMIIRYFDKLLKCVSRSSHSAKSFATARHVMAEPVVSVAQGRLQGAVQQLLDGTPYYSFKGVPYAQPPVGKLRFAAPLPPQPWRVTLDATQHGPVCPQFDLNTVDYVEGDENCLFLNVYTKSLQPDSKIPVMVFIHGGAYMSGNGNADNGNYGPEFLLQHGVILVTLNYRLEVLGFLSLDTPEVPGNAGMKDQVMALRWIKNNIAKFGGDPDNVTVFGESAGSASVIYHIQSPMSKGLFSKAIAQSGVSLNDWAQGKDGKERAFRVGKVLGKDTNDTVELLDFLRSVPAIKLAKLTMKTMTVDEKHRGLPMHFVPVVEKKFDNVEPFITEEPIDMLLFNRMNSVPLMLGYNSEEALLFLGDQLKKLNFINANVHYVVPREIAKRLSEEKVKEFGNRIRSHYVGTKEFSPDDALKVAHYLSDRHFAYNIHRFANFYSAIQRSTYMYRFSFETDLNLVKNVSGMSELKGASHADELFYLFCSIINKDTYEGQQKLKEIVFRVTKLWTDFAKTGYHLLNVTAIVCRSVCKLPPLRKEIFRCGRKKRRKKPTGPEARTYQSAPVHEYNVKACHHPLNHIEEKEVTLALSVYYRNPTPDGNSEVTWTPYSAATRDFLDINDKMTVGQYAEQDRIEFWNKLYCEAGLPCLTKSSL